MYRYIIVLSRRELDRTGTKESLLILSGLLPACHGRSR